MMGIRKQYSQSWVLLVRMIGKKNDSSVDNSITADKRIITGRITGVFLRARSIVQGPIG